MAAQMHAFIAQFQLVVSWHILAHWRLKHTVREQVMHQSIPPVLSPSFPRATAGHFPTLSVPGVGHLPILHCPGAGHLPTWGHSRASLRASSPIWVSDVSLAGTRERGGWGKESLQRSLINFHFHPGNHGTPQSVKTVTANMPQIRKVTTACQVS